MIIEEGGYLLSRDALSIGSKDTPQTVFVARKVAAKHGSMKHENNRVEFLLVTATFAVLPALHPTVNSPGSLPLAVRAHELEGGA